MIQKTRNVESVFLYIYNVVMFICKLLLVADIGITSFAVLGRYVPFIPDPAWSEEIVLTCMIYMALLSASLAIRRQAHIRMTALDTYLPQKVIWALDIFGDLVVLFFSIIMLYEGWIYALNIGGKAMYSSLPWLSKFWLYAPVPFAGLTMIIFQLEAICKHIGRFLGNGGEIE